ncbi:MAG: hypothetical protein CMJ18_01770 [Phycisphaeraceae bacterium]|nr:hypothetical protein [Phycisphaeraceae bacterium]
MSRLPDQGQTQSNDGERAERPVPKTIYVDWAGLETRLHQRPQRQAEPAPRRRLVTTVDAEVKDVRRNVRDSARAVLSWVSSVTEHDSPTSLDDVLDRCLRPGPDETAVNYTALADEIRRTLDVELSPKRIKKAIEHLRTRHEKKAATMQQQRLKNSLDALRERLQANFAALSETEHDQRHELRRATATEVLHAVRCAASRLIDSDYGEGIARSMDLDGLEGRCLDFVRDVVNETPIGAKTLPDDLHRLLVALCDYEGGCESDMRLVVDGARVVADLMGPDSLPGILAQLNTLVAGRHAIDTELYWTELQRLAAEAIELHDDAATTRYLNWVRRQEEEKRLPSPLRIASYCQNNAATHVLERLFQGELDGVEVWLERAHGCLDRMSRRDSGFNLIQTTRVVYLTVLAKVTGDDSEIRALFTDLPDSKAMTLLQDLAQYDNCVEIVRAAQNHATEANPELKHQLINLG